MNLKQLEYFSAAAEAKSISMAARNLHVAQPPVSRQIALLEDELGVCLFLRNNKGIELTEAGRCLYQRIEETFQGLRDMVDSVRDVDAGMRGQLKMGIVYSDIPAVVEHLREYHALYPQVEFYIRLGTPSDLLDDLNRGQLHILFLRSQTGSIVGLRGKVLGEDPLELVMTPETDPVPELDAVPVEALKGVPMCLLRSDDMWGYSTYLIHECQHRGFALNTVCQCYDTPMAIQMVQAGFGVSFLPRSIVRNLPHSGLYSKPVDGLTAPSYPILVWSDGMYHSKCEERFIQMANEKTWGTFTREIHSHNKEGKTGLKN